MINKLIIWVQQIIGFMVLYHLMTISKNLIIWKNKTISSNVIKVFHSLSTINVLFVQSPKKSSVFHKKNALINVQLEKYF